MSPSCHITSHQDENSKPELSIHFPIQGYHEAPMSTTQSTAVTQDRCELECILSVSTGESELFAAAMETSQLTCVIECNLSKASKASSKRRNRLNKSYYCTHLDHRLAGWNAAIKAFLILFVACLLLLHLQLQWRVLWGAWKEGFTVKLRANKGTTFLKPYACKTASSLKLKHPPKCQPQTRPQNKPKSASDVSIGKVRKRSSAPYDLHH
eukprot:1500861-Amphidinium_carterae.1